jgi:hypothetical protein
MVKLYKKLSMPSVHSKPLSSELQNASQYTPQLISIQNLNTAEREIKEDTYIYKSENKYKPTRKLIELFFKNSLLEDESKGRGEGA